MPNYVYDEGPTQYYDIEYGFCRYRRREQPILIQAVVSWKLREKARQAGPKHKKAYSHVITLRDISNAFPSVAFESLDEVLDSQYDTRDAAFLTTRYRDTHMKVEDEEGDWMVFRPGCGGLQGDGRAPQKFPFAYSRVLD